MADVYTPIAVKTKTAGDVDVDINSGPTGASALQTQGTVADGVAPNANPVLIAGFDGTLTQSISVDASGNVQVDVLTLPALPAGTNNIGDVDVLTLPALPAGTNNIGDVDVLSVTPGVGATDLGKAVSSASGATDTGVASLAVRDDTLSALTELAGEYVHLRVDVNGALWTRDDILEAVVAGSELQVDVVAPLPAGTNNIGDVDVLSLPALPAGTNNIGDVDVLSMPTGVSAAQVQGTAADGAAPVGNPVLIAGFDGTNIQYVKTDVNGELQVDVLTGGGSDTPTNPDVNGTLVNLATGVSGDVDSTDVGTATQKLAQVVMSSSAPFKARIITVADAAETERVVLFGKANDTVLFVNTHRNYIQQGPVGAGFDGFRVEFTNMDNVETADFYATFFVEE